MTSFDPIEVVVCLRDANLERALRQRFSKAMPGAHIKVAPGEATAFADVISVTGEWEGPDKPLVKAQEVVGEFNAELRARADGGQK